METAFAVAPEIGLAPACRTLGVCRATAYRHRSPKPTSVPRSRGRSPLALSDEERAAVLALIERRRRLGPWPCPRSVSLTTRPRRNHVLSRGRHGKGLGHGHLVASPGDAEEELLEVALVPSGYAVISGDPPRGASST